MNERDIAAAVTCAVKQCKNLFIERRWVNSDWNPKVVTSFSRRRARSWGGKRNGIPFISLSLHHFINKTTATMHEYKSFERDPEIGTISGPTEQVIRALVAHEMCHAAQFSGVAANAAKIAGNYKDLRGHGRVWKNMYRETRRALVNGNNVPVVSAPEEKEIVSEPPQNMIKRKEALRLIASWRHAGHPNAVIISRLVIQYGFKKSTATTYTYSVPATV